MGTYPDATAVFNVDAVGLCNLTNMLNHGYDLGRNPVGQPTEFCFGVALNPSAVNLERERERFHWKREAGAEFAITQPVFDAGSAPSIHRPPRGQEDTDHRRYLAACQPAKRRVHEERGSGVFVPDSVIARMARCDTKEAALEEGVAIAHELLEALKGSISGVQIAAPLGRIQLALNVLGL